MTLLDELMPRFDVARRYERRVRAPAERIWDALASYSVARDSSVITRTLLRLRGLRPAAGTGIGAFAGSGFTVVAERRPAEVVVAIAGRFWALRESGALDPIRDAADVGAYDTPGRAIALWSFEIREAGDDRCVLATETRVRCTDAAARRRFRVYWSVVEPFSGMIRRDMLASIAAAAERS